MLKIRQAQLDEFQQAAERRFVQSVIAHLRDHHPSELNTLDEARVERRVRNGIARSKAFGITWQSSITAFVAFTFVLGEEFDSNPRVREILEDRRTDPNSRLEKLVAAMSSPAWTSTGKTGTGT